jgi:site-specific recombinase XerC
MTTLELTNRAAAATCLPMQTIAARKRRSGLQTGSARADLSVGRMMWVIMSGALALGGCVSVNAPDKPIVIELNINIKQEVIYRLDADATKTIEENSGIF